MKTFNNYVTFRDEIASHFGKTGYFCITVYGVCIQTTGLTTERLNRDRRSCDRMFIGLLGFHGWQSADYMPPYILIRFISLSCWIYCRVSGHLHARRAMPPVTSSPLVNPAPKQRPGRPCGQPRPWRAGSFPPEQKPTWGGAAALGVQFRSVGRSVGDASIFGAHCVVVGPSICTWNWSAASGRVGCLAGWA